MRKGKPPKRLEASGADSFWGAAEYAADCHTSGALSGYHIETDKFMSWARKESAAHDIFCSRLVPQNILQRREKHE